MRTGLIGSLEVSVIGLGCNNFGRALDRDASVAVVRAALDNEITYFDTAGNYGEGRSEAFLGEALRGHRDQVVIATKFGVPVPGLPGSGGASPAYVREAMTRSLAQLGTDYVDLYQIHFPDPATPIEDTLAVMTDLVIEGKARQIGCSNFSRAELAESLHISDEKGYSAFVSDQVEFSLVNRAPESNGLLEECERRGVALLPFYPLASGLLTGKTARDSKPRGRLAMERYRHFLTHENFDLVEKLEDYARRRGIGLVEVALGSLLAHPAIPAVTPGATRPDQVESNARAADWSPSPQDLSELAVLIGPPRT